VGYTREYLKIAYYYIMYSKITNPINGRRVLIASQEGKTVLKNYLFFMKGGATHSVAVPTLYDIIKEEADTMLEKMSSHSSGMVEEEFYKKFGEFLVTMSWIQTDGAELLSARPWVPITKLITDDIKGLAPGGHERERVLKERFDKLVKEYAELLTRANWSMRSYNRAKSELLRDRGVYLTPNFVLPKREVPKRMTAQEQRVKVLREFLEHADAHRS